MRFALFLSFFLQILVKMVFVYANAMLKMRSASLEIESGLRIILLMWTSALKRTCQYFMTLLNIHIATAFHITE